MTSMNRVLLCRRLFCVSVLLWLQGCSSELQHQDLQEFLADAKAQPVGQIEPLPTFNPYETFKYSAVAYRSPFEKPLAAVAEDLGGKSTVKPDESRKKEYLESLNFSSFSLVGAISRDGSEWSLIDDGQGAVHRVTVGNYLGKNHGKIVSITESKVDVIEIVPDGKSGWVERPRTLAIREND